MTDWLEPLFLIQTLGLAGVLGIVFAESGLFFGFFLPGDSLLFTAGFLASQGYLPIITLTLGSWLAAVLGDSVGYAFGRRVGPKIFVKEDSLFFKKDYIRRAQYFYEKYGVKTIVLARFVPIVRTFAPIVAGVGNMRYRTFFIYNLLGGGLWTLGMSLAGYFLGKIIPGVDKYLLPIIFIIIIVSILPGVWEIWRSKKHD